MSSSDAPPPNDFQQNSCPFTKSGIYIPVSYHQNDSSSIALYPIGSLNERQFNPLEVTREVPRTAIYAMIPADICLSALHPIGAKLAPGRISGQASVSKYLPTRPTAISLVRRSEDREIQGPSTPRSPVNKRQRVPRLYGTAS